MRNFCLKKINCIFAKTYLEENMKTTSEYIALLRKYMAENAHKYGIVRMGIFGSVARGEQTEIVMWMCVWKVSCMAFSL